MYSKLLVPLDGSHLSEAVLPYARFLSKALNLPVELLQIIGVGGAPTLPYPRFGRYVASTEADLKKRGIDYLEDVGRSFPQSSMISRSVEVGHPAAVIVAKAAAHTGTLIAMSTRGRWEVRRWVLGSVANKVLLGTPNPLLLVKATAESKTTGQAAPESLLVPLDGSSLAETALPSVTALAKQMNLGVVLLMVYSAAPMDYVAAAYMPAPQQAAVSTKRGAKSYLEGKAQQLRGEGLDNVSWLLSEGDAPREIIKIARQRADNFVVMCTHGRSGLARWLLGSVTDRIIRQGNNPVLVIRAQANHEFTYARAGNGKKDQLGMTPTLHQTIQH